MSAHVCGVLPLAGTEPPPERIEPSIQAAMKFALLLDVVWFCALLVTVPVSENAGRSGCVIWPTFSASDMRDSRSSTRWAIGSAEFRYGNPCALMTTVGGLWLFVIPEPLALVAVNGHEDRLAPSPGPSCRPASCTSIVLTVPDAVPAGNTTVPVAGV